MDKFQQYLNKNRAAIFDWSVITVSFLLGFIFPTIKDFARSGGFHYWMLATLLLYIAGAALKHLPLSYRLHVTGQSRAVPYIIFLVVGHWFIFLFVIIFAEPAFRELAALPPLTQKNTGSWQMIVTASIVSAFVTWLVYRSKSKWKGRREGATGPLFYRELTADILLISSVSILSFAFWEKGVMAMLARSSTQTIGDIWFLFVFLSVLFLFFYLPLRYLYFVEDREVGRNRRRLFLLFGFMLLRALFEMLNT
jgi:hypothetical protein